MRKIVLLLVVCICLNVKCVPILDNLPVTFEMLGTTTYNPDSGGATLSGYQLRIGYTGHSWIAVEFPDTPRSDVLVVTANDFYTKMNNQFSGHQVLVNDYNYNSTVNTSILQLDKNTTNDISSFNYTNEKQFYLTITRFLGSNGG